LDFPGYRLGYNGAPIGNGTRLSNGHVIDDFARPT